MKDLLFPLRVLHGRLHDWRVHVLPSHVYYTKLLFERITHPHAVYLVMTPEHGNLGDHAIAESEIELLNEMGVPFIEYPWSTIKSLADNNKLGIMNGRTILVHGGGNMGTLWFVVEQMTREIIVANPNSKIVMLPNTVFYEKSEWGQQEFERSKQIYNAHDGLFLFARERASYHVMKEAYTNVSMVPDMVFYLNRSSEEPQRHGCILSLRSDKEKTRSDETDETVFGQARLLFGDEIKCIDMVVPRAIPVESRRKELEAQFAAFSLSKLVITDRLHGMVFCAITGTPCIVIDSLSPKIRGCYEWIKDLPYIRFCDDVSNIASLYYTIPQGIYHYDASKLRPLFEPLKRTILDVNQ